MLASIAIVILSLKFPWLRKWTLFCFLLKTKGLEFLKNIYPESLSVFFRVDPARSKDAGGTGLGLAIVKHIVNQHRATMDIISTEGKGTEFTIEFPKV